MAVATRKGRESGSKLDTSYTNFDSEKGVRSPRTPTYVPDSSSTRSIPPFDHSNLFADSVTEDGTKRWHPPPPERPMAWIWICHLCHSRYALGVTRRCLIDGHYYCSGEIDKPSIKKTKKHKACSSEFDYASWTAWGDWRRKALRTIHNERVFKGCDYCDFPSQCRYPVDTHPLGDLGTSAKKSGSKVETSQPAKEDISQTKSTANDKVDFDQILKNIFGDTETTLTDLDQPTEVKQKTGSNKKKRGGSKTLAPVLELDLSGDDLAEMDWAHFEEIELGKTKIG